MLNKKRGYQAEQFICDMLTKNGYTIFTRNYTIRLGEIDIVAQKEHQIYCIEVKLRKNPLFDIGTIITRSKQKKIIATAKHFMAAYQLDRHTIQFDVAFVSEKDNNFSYHYISNAFYE